MSIFNAIHSAVAVAGAAWRDKIEPAAVEALTWLNNLVKSVGQEELNLAITTAKGLVAAAIPAIVDSIKSGNTDAVLDQQWDLAKATVQAALDDGKNLAITTAGTAVSALISGHPDVVAANASVAPEPVAVPAPGPAA